MTKYQSQTLKAAAPFVVERADTETAPVCFPLSFFGWFCFFFPFTETALCINDCEEINLLSREIYGASSYWADRLGSP